MIKDIVTHPEKYASNENENIRNTGEKVWIVWTNQPIFDEEGRLKEILCIGIDHTQQKLAEETFARQLKEKTASEERNRLARDLHDAVSQTLFSASIIADVLPRLWERNQEEARKRLEEVRQLTRGALAEMRTLLLELRPAALVDADMGELMRQLADSITSRARIPVHVEIDGLCPQAKDLKIALYRIAQEALNNVAKHSRAARADVILHCKTDNIELIIRDNGQGFDLSAGPSASLGLEIMKERAKDIGATLTIESRPGQGTAVTLVYKNKRAEACQ
jgi:signal transduction histidine kinase